MIEKKNNVSTFMAEFMMGAVATAVAQTILNPIDVFKAKRQFMNRYAMYQYTKMLEKAMTAELPTQIGIKKVVQNIIQENGIKSFFRGNLLMVQRRWPTEARNFALNDLFKRMFAKTLSKDGFWIWTGSNLASGALAGAVSLGGVYSITQARVKLNRDIKMRKKGQSFKYNNLIDVYKKTFTEEGIGGLFRGFTIACANSMIYRALYFGLFDTIRPMLQNDAKNRFYVNFLVGWAGIMLANLAAHPVDTVRRRLLIMEDNGQIVVKALECAREIIKNEGCRALFSGSSFFVSRSLTGGLALASYEKLQLYMFKKVKE